MQDLTILHISDLHYSQGNKKEIEHIKAAILNEADTFVKVNGLMPDFIIFSGDLVFKPDNDEASIKIFEEAYTFFIKPIINKFNLTDDDIFITPGNHDVNRSVLTRGDTVGLFSYAESKKIVNQLIEEIATKKTTIAHLDQYNKFVDTLSNKNEIFSNEIFRVYKKTIGKVEIGIVNLNSTILSFGDESYGKLIIGEEQLRQAYSYVENCDIKIANIHHSVNWLVWFEQQLVKKFYYKHFNLVFIGHEHMEQPELVNFNDEDTLIVNSASIFQSRNKINGYSLLNYRFDAKEIDIYVREYDDRESKFATVTFRESANKYSYQFNILEKSKSKKNIELILDEMKMPIKELIQKELLINTAKNENNTIEDIFVEPHIYTKSEFLDSKEDKELYTISKIIYAKKTVIIKGIESSGKTTLLNFLANEYLNMNSPELKIPVILNYLDINNNLSGTLLFAKTIDYFRKLNMNISSKELETLVKEGCVVYLIDNFVDSDDAKKVFADSMFKNNKFIFSAKEEIFNSINVVDSESEGNSEDVIELFLYNLKRDKARTFFGLYFKNSEFKNNEFEGIYKFISKLNIPLTIFNYTLIAHVYENQKSNFKPVNEAYLIDLFMEYLLEKLDISKNTYIGSLGYNLKSSYLIYLAKWMVNNDTFSIDKYKLLEITSAFIQELKREKEGINIEYFITYLEEKGVLVNTENNLYRFRYRAFLEFFIAKGMEKDSELKAKIINEQTCLSYKNEIRYYSGLHGEDEALVTFFNDLVQTNSSYFDEVEDIETTHLITPSLNISGGTVMPIEQISHDGKDKLMETNKAINVRTHNGMKIVKEVDVDKTSQEKRLFQINLLFANVIRNSEQLRNPEMKVKAIKLIVDNLSKFLQSNLQKNKELKSLLLIAIESPENTENATSKDVDEFCSVLNVVIAQVFMSLIHHNLASDGLFTIFNEMLDETSDGIVKLLIASTFVYSEDYKAIDLIKKVILDREFSTNKFLMTSLFLKIHQAIKLRDIDPQFKSKLEGTLNDIIEKINYNEVAAKGVNKKRLVSGQKKNISEKIKKSLG